MRTPLGKIAPAAQTRRYDGLPRGRPACRFALPVSVWLPCAMCARIRAAHARRPGAVAMPSLCLVDPNAPVRARMLAGGRAGVRVHALLGTRDLHRRKSYRHRR